MNRHFKITAISFLLFLPFQVALAGTPTDSIAVHCRIMDNFTHALIPNAKIEVLVYTGETVAVHYTLENNDLAKVKGESFNMYVHRAFPKSQKSAILRISKSGYETTEVTVPLKHGNRQSVVRLPDIRLKKTRELGEAVVTASKVMMVVKDDTLVYNADAFQLAEGSMLNALIRQLPGAELDDNGRITVNGRFVSNLLVNGENFFKGDPSIALENLPAYMVNKIKVYEQERADAYLTREKKRKGENPLVMDVTLKRQYAQGWIANAEAGMGTDDRYLARVFGLRFTDCSRLALFANINNLNDTREPGSTGDWRSSHSVSGLAAQKTGGIDLLVKDRDNKWKLQSNAKVRHEDSDNREISAAERFLSGGNTYKSTTSQSTACNTSISVDNRMELRRPTWYLNIVPQGKYRRYNNAASGRAVEFTRKPYDSYRGATIDSIFFRPGSSGMEQFLANRLETTSLGEGYLWDGSFRADFRFMVPYTPDNLYITVQAGGNKRNDKRFSHFDLRYADPDMPADFRNQYNTLPQTSYNFNGTIQYSIRLSEAMINPTYEYARSYRSANRSLYRLDKYANTDWSSPGGAALGTLPSTVDSLQQAIDLQNSYHSTAKNDTHKLTPQIVYFPRSGRDCIAFYPNIRFSKDRLIYRRGDIDENVARDGWFFEPEVNYEFLDHYILNYKSTTGQPQMTDMLDITDDVNPLYVVKGNPGLKNTKHHRFSLKSAFGAGEKGVSTYASVIYNLWKNAIGNYSLYDRATGTTTTTPQNINGNWSILTGLNHTRPLDKRKRLIFSTDTEVNFYNSVDFTQISDAANESPRSSVRNFQLNEKLRTTLRMPQYTLTLTAGARWNNTTGSRPDFQDINSVDMSYGLSGTFRLPWKLSLSSDITLYCRRGYTDRSMNTDDFVWNARISRSIMRGNLTFMLDGFDILHQLSNVRRNLNAQGRTETWYNTLPRYAMLHVIYRLNIKPKKRPGDE